jgi:membrane-associated HD superfamily phosphohydrolase
LIVQFLVKWLDKLHQFAGYAAILLIAVHGIYFLVQAAVKRETYTGIAAFALLLSLGVYGFLMRRVPNKYMRKVHFLLATAFAAVALIHAGGSAIAAILSIIVFWLLIRLLDRKTKLVLQK